jgi:hypothetical protein
MRLAIRIAGGHHGLSDVESGKNDGIKWKIAEPFGKRNDIFTADLLYKFANYCTLFLLSPPLYTPSLISDHTAYAALSRPLQYFQSQLALLTTSMETASTGTFTTHDLWKTFMALTKTFTACTSLLLREQYISLEHSQCFTTFSMPLLALS